MSLKRRLVFDNSVLIEWLGPIVFIATAFLAQPAPLELQINALHAATIAEEPAKNVFLPPDRHTLQKLLHAKLLLAKGLYSEAVENLGSILDSPEDYFFQYQQDQPIYRSLKSEAQRLIGQMPLEGRELYELQYGSQAKKLLETAVASPNLEFLQQVSRRYFHTQAGYEATFLLGLRQLDHGQALAGAYTLQRLIDHSTSRDQFEPALSLGAAMGWMQAGKPEKTREIMANFCQRRRQAKWKAEAERIPQFKNDSEAFDWLHQLVARQNISKNVQPNSWLIHGGNPQHNPVTVSGSPFLNLCWHMPLADDPLIQDVWDQKRRYYLEQEIPFLPNLHPLVVDDVLLMRTYKNLLAVDFNSGKRLWEAPADDFPEKLLLGENEANPLAESMAVLLSNRRSNNTNFGKLSSDGRLVFCIEDFDLSDGEKAFFGTTRQRLNIKTLSDPPTDNRLAAYDIHTGKLTWQLGGDTQEFGVRLPETFFLGPPLPLMGKLYVLAQRKSEIYLFVLNPANGTTCWSQQLAIVEDDAQMDSIRRCTGISPSYAAGILVCPTSSGALTAVDLASESLLWGFPYVRYNPVVGISMAAPLIFSSRPKSARLFRAAGGVCICESRVLAAPPDSDTLYCLNLTNGESYWNYKLQDEDVYVGCVAKGKVFLVGRHQVRALNLSDGKLAWDGRTVALPEGAMPSGQGFCAGDSYFLPLDSAEVAEINLTEGKLAHLYESRGGFVPGNLICCKGRVISQGNEGVDVFYQLDAAKNEVRRRLANDPSDAKGLCLQGEIFLESGNRVKAIDCFRRAYSANGDLHSRELLCDTLLEGLEKEFAVYRRHSDEIEHLLDNPGQRAAYLRLMAVGLQEEGDLASAFAHYLKLIDLESNKLPMETLSKTLSVRRDRWIQGQLGSLCMEAKGEIAAKITAEIQARLLKATSVGTVESLRQFLRFFGNQPLALDAQRELLHKLVASGQLFDAEMALWTSADMTNPEAVAPASASVAEMFRTAGRTEIAASMYKWLRRQYHNQICCAGKTVEQLLKSLPSDDALRRLLDHKDTWPVGDVKITSKNTPNKLMNTYGQSVLKFDGSPGPFFADLKLIYDHNAHRISCMDGYGGELWQISLANIQTSRRQFTPFNPEFARPRAIGHLLLLPIDSRLYAFDALDVGPINTPRILWSEPIGQSFDGEFARQQFLMHGPLGGVIHLRMTQRDGYFDELALATADYLCIRRGHTLAAIDPLSGSMLWERKNIAPNSAIFGDDERIFVLPPDKAEAAVLSVLDGESLGTRTIPRGETHFVKGGKQVTRYRPLQETCPLALGRKLLYWRSEKNQQVLDLFDAWTQKSVWLARKFNIRSRYCIVDDRAVAIFQPDGHFVLMNLCDGRVLIERQFSPEPQLTDLIVMPSAVGYLVLTQSVQADSKESTRRSTRPLPGHDSKPVSYGRLYAIDQNGKSLWENPAEVRNQQLLISQPAELPVLLFACQLSGYKHNNRGRAHLSILALDKRSGRTVYKNTFSSRVPRFLQVVGNEQDKTVDLILQGKTVTLTFTDKPYPSAEEIAKRLEAERLKTKKIKESVPRALFKSFGRGVLRLFGATEDDEEYMDEFDPASDGSGQ